ncbi:carcinoembryonic antigen-related cell adhesion molecule 1-like [Bufo bufo]|uniref:carcinoembryonic antigen-related cell adhesion molecule 1-like n=1 Tax=Bufo bufo TaxID=8384 RepID=UPI001ABDDE61|nr:carcinoembryonic antigen-related cell adhesion molecule 1-like [Bufo bufo]
MYVVNGTNVTFLCDAGGQTENVTTYTFYRDQTPICIGPHVSCSESSLDFTPISEIYNGSYTCRIENPVSSNLSDPINVTVSFRISDISLTVNTSALVWPGLDSVSLRCSARGTNVSYSWSLDGAALPAEPHYVLSADRSVLTISPVSSKDNGSFTCTAANSINNLTSPEVLLHLGSPVSAVTLSSNASSAELWAEQDSVSLHCSAQGSAITFTWSLDGKPVSSKPPYYITESNSPPNSNLTISPISRNDGGPFTCTASNLLNSSTSNELSFSLNWRPDGEMSCPVTSNGDILSLVCSWENGRPPANVTMTFNDTTGMNPNIVTRNVSSKTLIWGSVLNCTGDQLGKTSICQKILEPPYFLEQNNTIKDVPEGGSVILTINLNTRPTSRISSKILPATFTWYKDKTEIKSGVNSTSYSSNLHLSEVTQANSGRYECTSRNVIGSETLIFNVNVTAKAVPPKNGLDGGEIAGIVIGVLAGLTIIGIIVFFIVKKKKRHDDDRRLKDSTDQIDTIQYAEVALNKENGGVAETTMSTNPADDKDELKYAAISFKNKSSTKSVAPTTPQETVYSDVKNVSNR